MPRLTGTVLAYSMFALFLQAGFCDRSLAAEAKPDAEHGSVTANSDNTDINPGGIDSASSTASAEQDTSQHQSKATPLTGTVSRSDFSHDVQQQHSENQSKGTLDSGVEETPKFHLFSKRHKYVMTSADYRNLQFGVTGFESTMLSGKYQVVTHVFRNCPAEAAGILPGDRVLKANDHVFTEHDAQKEVWKYMDGRAGTEVVITILRKKEVLTFRLLRMNIEDIQDARLRWTYEHLVHTLGTPGY